MQACPDPDHVTSPQIMSPLAARLEGLGAPPTEDELEHLIEPQRDWWNDRHRIVLLYEYVESQDDNFEEYFEYHGAKALMVRPPLPFRSFPPSQPLLPHVNQEDIEGRACRLWMGGIENWRSTDATAAGYRFLTSLPSCPRCMRLPMGPELYLSGLKRAAERGHEPATLAIRRLKSPYAFLLK